MRTTLGNMLGLLNLNGAELLVIFLALIVMVIVAAIVGLIIFLAVRAGRKHEQNGAAPQPPALPPPAERTQVFPRRCPKCGAALKPDAPEGLCPACLLQQGIATEGGAPPGTPAFTPPSLAELAKLFPQLEILESIGQGGMGAVYKARQPSLDRFVALKILAPRTGGDLDFSGRFSREARALARLNHPNIVAVHDFGTVGEAPSPSGQPAEASGTRRTPLLHYFIMEYVDGPNLRQVEQAGKLSPREALQIIPQICAALQFAHDEGIVHRDIKPENVLLDKKGRVKIADFGLAKILGQEADLRLTGARDVMGTPHYMAPEQVETPQEVDHRADIYSLGVVFYEMLTGELPLGKFDPPSHRVQIDVRLDDVVMRSLSKSPDRRYQHVSEIRTDVETIAQTPSTAGAQTSAAAFGASTVPADYELKIGRCIARGWNLVKRNFWPVFAVNTLVVVLLAFMGSFSLTLSSSWPGAHFGSVLSLIFSGPLLGGLYLYFLKLIRGERANMETLFSGFSGHFLQLFLGNFVGTLLVLLGFLCLILPGIYLATAWLFTLVLIIDKRLEFWPAMELSRKVITKHWWKFLGFAIVLFLMKITGLLLCIIGFFIAGPIVHAAFLYAYEDIFGAKAGAAIPPSPRRSGGAGWKIALGTAAAIAFVAILAIAAAGVWHLATSRHRSQTRQRQIAERDAEVARERLTRESGRIANEGWQLWQARRLDAAAKKFQESVKIDADNTNAWNGLGWAQFNSGKAEEAEDAFQKAVALDPEYAASLNGLGQIRLSQGKYEDAEKYLLKAAPDAPAAQYGLARLYLLEGKFDEAQEWAQKVVDLGETDDLSEDMLQAARQKHLSDDLRQLIKPSAQIKSANAAAAVETWSPALAPGEKPDLQKILQQAKELADTGHYEEALQHHIWYHNHALEYDQGQVGVRLSFALADWIELGRQYPKARRALIEIRDRDTEQLSSGVGGFKLFMDVNSINGYLDDTAATLTLFKKIESTDKSLARQCFLFVEPLLIQRGEYDACLDYIGDPQGAFEGIRNSRAEMKKLEDRQAEWRAEEKRRFEAMGQTNAAFARLPVFPDPPKTADNSFIGQTRQLIEVLVGADRKAEAEKIRDEALAVLDDDRIRSAVDDAERDVQKRSRASAGAARAARAQEKIETQPAPAPNAPQPPTTAPPLASAPAASAPQPPAAPEAAPAPQPGPPPAPPPAPSSEE